MSKFNEGPELPSLPTSGDLKNGFLREASQLPWQYRQLTRMGNGVRYLWMPLQCLQAGVLMLAGYQARNDVLQRAGRLTCSHLVPLSCSAHLL